MKRVQFTLALCVLLSLSVRGQYTYFNKAIAPPYPEVGYGAASNLLLRADTVISFGIYPFTTNEVEMRQYYLNSAGEVIQETSFVLEENGFTLLQYSESIVELSDGRYMHATGYSDLTLGILRPTVQFYSGQFEPMQTYQILNFDADSILAGEFFVARELFDESKIAIGTIGYDNNPNFPGQSHSSVLLARFDDSGNIWYKEHHFYLDQIFPTTRKFFKASDVFEMPNGDLLVWGCFYHDWQPVVLRFDSEGNFLSHCMWGNPTASDFLPFAVRTGDEEFVFAYRHTDWESDGGTIFAKPRGGVFNSADMTVELWESWDHLGTGHYVMDLEMAHDSLPVLLAYGIMADSDTSSHEAAYLLKFDLQGNELWYKEVSPPMPFYQDSWVYDLELMPDGGFAVVGEVWELDENGNQGPIYTWIFKTDACGDVVFNGCPPPVGVAENAKPAGLMLYPNPANNQLNIILPPGGNRAEVYSLSGQLVMSQFIYPGWDRAAIDVSGLAGGMYLVQVVQEGGEVMGTGRFVRE